MAVGGQRFGREVRLTTPAAYRRVFQKSRRSADAVWTLLARQNRVGHARLGLAISRRNVRTAVARHRIKRMARESFRLRRAELPAFDFVVLCRPRAAELNKRQLSDTLNQHWQRFIRQCTGS